MAGTPMFQRNPNGLASRGDKVRGCIALALCIGSYVAAYHATDNQWLAFFMVNAFLNMLVAIGIVFKEV